MRLLSVDWDYFFPILSDLGDKDFLYDWGHKEGISFMLNGIWDIRAAAFVRAGMPLPGTSGKEKNFWNRFKFSPEATLYYSDSHSLLYRPEASTGITTIWNFDAHHDAYQKLSDVVKAGVVTCDNWATVLHLTRGIKIYTLYPEWAQWKLNDKPKTEISIQIDHGKPFHRIFDRVFLCRSGAWTPTWVEDKFWEFLESCPVSKKVAMDGMAEREFHIESANELNRQLQEALNANKEARGFSYDNGLHSGE